MAFETLTLDKQEALKPAGPTFVEGEVVDSKKKEPEKKKTGLFAKFSQLSDQIDQMRKDAEKKAQEKQKRK